MREPKGEGIPPPVSDRRMIDFSSIHVRLDSGIRRNDERKLLGKREIIPTRNEKSPGGSGAEPGRGGEDATRASLPHRRRNATIAD